MNAMWYDVHALTNYGNVQVSTIIIVSCTVWYVASVICQPSYMSMSPWIIIDITESAVTDDAR